MKSHPLRLAQAACALALALIAAACSKSPSPDAQIQPIPVQADVVFPPPIFDTTLEGKVADVPIQVRLKIQEDQVLGEILFRTTEKRNKLAGTITPMGLLDLKATSLLGEDRARIEAIMLNRGLIEGEWIAYMGTGAEPLRWGSQTPQYTQTAKGQTIGIHSIRNPVLDSAQGHADFTYPAFPGREDLNRLIRKVVFRQTASPDKTFPSWVSPSANWTAHFVGQDYLSLECCDFLQKGNRPCIAQTYNILDRTPISLEAIIGNMDRLRDILNAKSINSLAILDLNQFAFTQEGIQWYYQGSTPYPPVRVTWTELAPILLIDPPLPPTT